MQITETGLQGLLVIQPRVFEDERGFFLESYNHQRYEDAIGCRLSFVQDNLSRSEFGVLRGLHFQQCYPQGKLVSVVRGCVFDVAVDLRRESTTYGQSYGIELSDQNHLQLWIPPGFAHGFCVVSDFADFAYKCTDYYHPEDESGLAWNCPELNISWPVTNPKISAKDQVFSSFSEYNSKNNKKVE